MAKINYTPEIKKTIEQLCRSKNYGTQQLSAEQWRNVLNDVLSSKLDLDIFHVDGEPRLLVHRNSMKAWKPCKIHNDLLYFTDGNETISENMLIVRYAQVSEESKNRYIGMTNNTNKLNLKA